jgi:2-(1,2-epoxy-1,2-dihydrophenyl)acetyl-CoA isomerase
VAGKTYEQLIVERRDPVATVRMNNPSRLNAFTWTLAREMVEALEALATDPAVRAVVLTGEGRAFSAGADLSAFQEPYLKGERPKVSEFLEAGYNRLIPLITGMAKPVIGALNGVVAGAGVSLALACDYRLAADDVTFSMAFVRIGLIPDAGSTYLLPRTVGMARALEMALLSDKIDADAALRFGLVNRVVPPAQLLDEANALAERLAALPTLAIGMTKRLFLDAATKSLPEALAAEAVAQDEAAQTDDHIEGVMAFLEKRTPDFRGH